MCHTRNTCELTGLLRLRLLIYGYSGYRYGPSINPDNVTIASVSYCTCDLFCNALFLSGPFVYRHIVHTNLVFPG